MLNPANTNTRPPGHCYGLHTFVLYSDGSHLCSKCGLYKGGAWLLSKPVEIAVPELPAQPNAPAPWNLNGRPTPGRYECGALVACIAVLGLGFLCSAFIALMHYILGV